MCEKMTLNQILSLTSDELKRIYGKSLIQIILYGSYARNDYDDSSDIDVAILVDQPRTELQKSIYQLSDFSSDIGLEFDILLSLSPIPYSEFLKYKDDLPYYQNIDREGIVLSA
jgi:predicted nucleotidyltransferase